MLPVTSRVLPRAAACATAKVPLTTVLPLVASTVKLLLTLKLPSADVFPTTLRSVDVNEYPIHVISVENTVFDFDAIFIYKTIN